MSGDDGLNLDHMDVKHAVALFSLQETVREQQELIDLVVEHYKSAHQAILSLQSRIERIENRP